MNILLLGASGNIGGEVAKSLKANKHNVVGLGRKNTDLIFDLNTISNAEITKLIIDYGIEVIVNLSAVIIPQTIDDFLLNSAMYMKFLNNELGRNLKHIIIGSAAEYGVQNEYSISEKSSFPNPTNLYGISKFHQSCVANYYKTNLGVDVIVLRLFNIITPKLQEKSLLGRIFTQIETSKREPLIVNNKNIVRDFLDIRDFSSLVCKSVESKFVSETIFNVASGVNTTYESLFDSFNVILTKYNLEPLNVQETGKEEKFSKAICDNSLAKVTFDWEVKYKPIESIEYCLNELNFLKK